MPEEAATASSAAGELAEVLKEGFLTNKVSAKFCHTIAQAAIASSATRLGPFAKRVRHRQNMARSIFRGLKAEGGKMSSYWLQVPLWDPNKQEQQLVELPMALPHEMLLQLAAAGELPDPALAGSMAWSPIFKDACRELGLSAPTVHALALWADGVPYSKKHSLQVLTVSFSACPQGPRYLVATVSSKHLCACGCRGVHTMDAFWEAISWSCRLAFLGRMPTGRHDGRMWQPSDAWRAERAGGDLGAQGLLFQLKGDWDWFSKFWSLPYWQSKRFCWLCPIEQEALQSGLLHEPELWDKHHYFRLLRGEGKHICPLYSAPGVNLYTVLPRLHACGRRGRAARRPWQRVLAEFAAHARGQQEGPTGLLVE